MNGLPKVWRWNISIIPLLMQINNVIWKERKKIWANIFLNYLCHCSIWREIFECLLMALTLLIFTKIRNTKRVNTKIFVLLKTLKDNLKSFRAFHINPRKTKEWTRKMICLHNAWNNEHMIYWLKMLVNNGKLNRKKYFVPEKKKTVKLIIIAFLYSILLLNKHVCMFINAPDIGITNNGISNFHESFL